jgi:hypothetical protein
MVELVNVKAGRFVFSIKKGKILSGLIPHLKLPHESFLADVEDKITERKRGRSPFSFEIYLKKHEIRGQSPFL